MGDRFEAAQEMVEGGPIDVLTGDYLAELTMFLLWKLRSRGRPGYADAFLRQLEVVLGTCMDRGIRIVVNAGGLDPAGLAEAVTGLAGRLSLAPSVAHLTGDDLLDRMPDLLAAGEPCRHLDTGQSLAEAGIQPVTANAYLGAWGIAEALTKGADIVVCPRVTDASLTVGPAAWWFRWARDDYDALAGAVAAGHVLECGPQATGGNFSFFEEIPGLEHPGFPLAEISADGSSVITKHPGTGGAVTTETVTAQLLYEIAGPRYPNPDVTARFDTVEVSQMDADRVRMSGCRGEPPPPDLKVCINYLGGYKNRVTFVLTGLDIAAKADLVRKAFVTRLGDLSQYDELEFRLEPHLVGMDSGDASTSGRLDVLVKSADPDAVGRRFSSNAAALFLATYPGFYLAAPPSGEEAYAVYWPTLVPRSWVREVLVVDGQRYELAPARVVTHPVEGRLSPPAVVDDAATLNGDLTEVALGRLVGARSGDKGGNANIGVWARNHATHAWMRAFLTAERVAELLPELAGCAVERFDFPNLRAVNFVVRGVLGQGVASSTRADPQAKALGECLRAVRVDVPGSLVGSQGKSASTAAAPIS
jgi:hypothetical protein